MALLEIKTYGDPVLRKKCEPITEITPELRQLAKDMLETMYDAPGCGLAAPQILSMTEQMVLNAVIKTVQQSKEPLNNGTFTVKTEALLKVAKRAMFGATLTTRTLFPLLERKLLSSAISLGDGSVLPEIEAIPSFSGDFDTILDLMELNRIYPLLDKKLV